MKRLGMLICVFAFLPLALHATGMLGVDLTPEESAFSRAGYATVVDTAHAVDINPSRIGAGGLEASFTGAFLFGLGALETTSADMPFIGNVSVATPLGKRFGAGLMTSFYEESLASSVDASSVTVSSVDVGAGMSFTPIDALSFGLTGKLFIYRVNSERDFIPLMHAGATYTPVDFLSFSAAAHNIGFSRPRDGLYIPTDISAGAALSLDELSFTFASAYNFETGPTASLGAEYDISFGEGSDDSFDVETLSVFGGLTVQFLRAFSLTYALGARLAFNAFGLRLRVSYALTGTDLFAFSNRFTVGVGF